MGYHLGWHDPGTQPIAFVWDATEGATSYLLQVGTATGQSDIYNENVGDMLTTTLRLAVGTYYARVYAQPSNALSPNGEQVVTV